MQFQILSKFGKKISFFPSFFHLLMVMKFTLTSIFQCDVIFPAVILSKKVSFVIYSQTWVNDHFRIMTTCLQQPPFWGPSFNFYNIKLSVNSDHLSTTASNLGSRRWSLYTVLAIYTKPSYEKWPSKALNLAHKTLTYREDSFMFERNSQWKC